MSKRSGLTKLRVELLAAALVSLAFAFAVQQIVYYAGIAWVNKRMTSEDYMEKHAARMIDSLQSYIDEQRLLEDDTSKLHHWQRREGVSFSLYDDVCQEITYYYSFSDDQPLKIAVSEDDYELTESSADASGTLVFADGSTVTVLMLYDRVYTYYNLAYAASLLVSALWYMALFLLFINRKIQYIKQLADELKILEGGDLEYAITVKGKDEISELAEGINSMRQAVLSREQEERQNVRSNRDMVTALSHDIRTPMTSLIGYLEILKMHRFQTPEQEQKYLESAHQKAFQMKEMTDTLFEYSLVSGKTEETYELEMVSVADFLNSVEDTQMADLLSDGWMVRKEFSLEGMDGFLEVDMDFYRRIMDNLVSNIRKYADKSSELVFSSGIRDNSFYFSVKNRVLQGETLEGSTGVGLKTCEKIMRDMNGVFRVERDGDTFTVVMVQPYVRKM